MSIQSAEGPTPQGLPWTEEMVAQLKKIQSQLRYPSTGFLPIIFDVAIFTTKDPSGVVSDDERESGQIGLLGFLHALAGWNAHWLKNNPNTPHLYDTGISYYHDHGIEWWADYCRAYERRKADCKVLAAARCADINRQLAAHEARNGLPRGQGARPHISWRRIGPNDPGGFEEGDWVYHVVVLRPSSSINIDPPPMLHTPAGPTLYPAKRQRWDGEIEIMDGYLIEDPSRVLGMGWESLFAQSNKRPSTQAFANWFQDAAGVAWQPTVISPVNNASSPHGGTTIIQSPYAQPSFAGRAPAALLPPVSLPQGFDYTRQNGAAWAVPGRYA